MKLYIPIVILLYMFLGLWIPAQAVGPLMENERFGNRIEGPNPDLIPPSNFAPRREKVAGEVLRIEGPFYVVRDFSGKEISLQVDKDTKMTVPPKLGDKIQVEVTPKGHAQSIKPARHEGE